MKDVIYSINGPVVTVKDTSTFGMAEMVYVGNAGLIGEVISVSGSAHHHPGVREHHRPAGG